MKSTLLTLSLGIALFPPSTLASNVKNDKICVPTPDTSKCTLTVVSQTKIPDNGKANRPNHKTNFVYVLDNECNSIIDSTSCNSDGLCLQDITDEHYPTDENPIVVGVKGKPYTVSLTEREEGDIWGYPPHFIYHYADDSGDDYKDTDGPCTCAREHRLEGQNSSTEVHAQVCNCWFTCDQ